MSSRSKLDALQKLALFVCAPHWEHDATWCRPMRGVGVVWSVCDLWQIRVQPLLGPAVIARVKKTKAERTKHDQSKGMGG